MASMNWLGFSLSPQELPQQPSDHHHHHHHQDDSQNTVSRLDFNSDDISGTDVSGDCFNLTSDSTAPSLNHLPPPFAILEAFNRNNHQPQDWNMKGLGMNSSNNYKTTSSELSMLMGSSCNSQSLENQQQPKLENFLGRHSFAHHETAAAAYNNTTDYMFNNSSLHLPSDGDGGGGGGSGGCGSTSLHNNSSIGLSMIKTWLRNQPAPPPPQPQPDNKNDSGGGGGSGGASGGNLTSSAQTLSLSMSTGSQSSSTLPLLSAAGGGSGGESSSSDNKPPNTTTGVDSQTGAIEAVPRKSIDTFGQRTSIYRGVTRHRWTGRYEAHLWDNSCRREGQTRKGRQVYLGGYDKEEKAARAYDLAALKYWGTTTTTNFPISNYEKELEEMKHMTRQEYVASLRRKSSGFSRGASIYRGVTRHHQHGRWQARIGRVAGNKDLYLGTFSTQEEAAEAYDIAAIKFRGLNAVTNFDMSRYDVKSILESSTLPIGGAAKRLKDVEAQAEMITVDGQRRDHHDTITSSHLTDGINSYGAHQAAAGWPTIAFQQPHQTPYVHYPYGGGGGQRVWCKQEQDSSDHTSFQDLHQLQLGNTHNFFHQNSVLHNLMGMESAAAASMEHSNGGGVGYHGNGSNGGGYVIPMSTVIGNDGGNNNGFVGESDDQVKAMGNYENHVFPSSTDAYHASRNVYYHLAQQSSPAVVKATGYDQGSTCNNWVPTAVPTVKQYGCTLPWSSNVHSLE